MTKKDILNLWSVFNQVKDIKKVKFAYAITKNKKIIESEVEALIQASASSEKYIEYEVKRKELAIKYGEKDDSGNLIINNGIINFAKETMNEAKANIAKLESEYKEALEEQKKLDKEYEELLKEEINIELYKIPFDYFPEEISSSQMDALIDIIEEDEKE